MAKKTMCFSIFLIFLISLGTIETVSASWTPVSDDFNSQTLNTSLWTVVNPKGDATITVIGNGTQDAMLSIAVPQGQEHDVWIGNNAPRIMQSIENKDFEIELKFQSQMTSAYQMEGLIVQQDSNNYLRFDIVRFPTSTNIFAASFTGGLPATRYNVAITSGNPLYLRVNRTGNLWKESYSFDGTNWIAAANFNYPMVVSSVGPFAGNGLGSSSPAFTGLIDYFFNTSSPIVPEDGDNLHIPVISSQPLNQAVTAGQKATYSVVATGTAPLSYQWQKNGFDIPGATNSSYTTPATTMPDNGSTFRVNVTNPLGSVMSGQATLTVFVSSTIVSDDFNSPTLNTALWTVVNPKGDATISVIGVGTQDALLSIAVPGGQEHDVWNGNNAPRVMQSVSNTNFEIELKFQSQPTLAYQIQGVIIQQDSNKYLRFDFVKSPTSTNIFAASFAGGSPTTRYNVAITPGNPIYLRVNRTGDQWRQSYSYDGNNWIAGATFNYPMIVSSAGPFAGNAAGSSSPAFTGLVDYFFDTSSPIVPEDGGNHQIPVISSQPLNQTVTIGENATFGVVATGSLPLSYQWQKNGTDISGAMNAIYTTPPTSMLDNGSTYRVNITNPEGSVMSNSATLTILPLTAPTIITQPSNQAVDAGHNAIFSVVATGSSPLSYQWQKNGTDLPGATNTSYTTPATINSDNGSIYRVNITNSVGSIMSDPAKLTVRIPLTIISDDFNSQTLDPALWTVVNPRNDATISIIGVGTQDALLSISVPGGQEHDVWNGNYAPRVMQSINNTNFEVELKFQSLPISVYQMQGVIIQQDTNKYLRFDIVRFPTSTNIFAASFAGGSPTTRYNVAITPGNPIYLRVNRTGDLWKQSYSYDGNNWIAGATFNYPMIVSSVGPFAGNAAGSSSPAFIGLVDYFFDTSSPIVPEDGGLPVVTSQPLNQSVTSGENATFGVVATGSAPLSYQWQKNGSDIPDATNASYTTPPTTMSDNGSTYRVNITNPEGSVMSNSATLTVLSPTPPTIIAQPSNRSVATGQNATFSVAATGSSPLSYQWQKNGTDIPGATSSSYTTPVTSISDNGSVFSINVTNPVGSVMSDQATLSVLPIIDFSGSDDFNSQICPDPSIWTVVNPRGDATISCIGYGTQDALLSIAVPGGQEHDVWNGNYAPRIMQSVENKDFEVELKFQSQPISAYQMQGVIIQQDSNKYLRFDFVRLPTSTNVFAASFAAGYPTTRISTPITPGNPIYLRVKRTGDQWKQSYSYDGQNWIDAGNFNYPMIVSSIGPFAGNAGGSSSPAFNGLVDYFFDTSSPKVPEDTPLPANIAQQPVNTTAFNGSTATFSVVAGGTPPFSYQWKKNGVDITNEIGSSYTTPTLDFPDNGTKFSVIVSNAYGSVTSNEVTLSIIEAPTIQWWDTQRNFRIPVTVNAAQYERFEKPVDVSLNFTQVLRMLGQSGTFDETSIRVVETDSTGVVLNSTVPFQFDKDIGFNAASKASGTIVFIMNGNTPANTNRYYHVYFGLTGKIYSPLSVTPRLTFTDNVQDQGQSSYQIGAGGSTYYFQKQAGGFSSLLDANGNDWISYQPTPANSAGGSYRGISNVYTGGIFHPGWSCCTSSIVTQGPLKIRVRSVSPDGLWENLWDFYPGYATNTMVKVGGNYWWLYEGTPGGSLDPNDFMVRSDNTQTPLSVSTNVDFPTNEWVYFSDPAVNRSLFVSHHEDDSLIDGYYPMTDFGGSMTVFGFGRNINSYSGNIPSSSVPQHFTMGLWDGTGFAQGSKIVYSAYKDLSIATGVAEQLNSPAIIITQPANSSVTMGRPATFSISAAGQLPLLYQWQKNNVNIPGATNASYTTPPTNLSDNGLVFRVVVTNAFGSATSNQATLTVGAASNPNQLVILDVNYTHNTGTMAFSFFDIPSNVPNKILPANFTGGTLYQRLQVITKPSTRTVKYQYCVFQYQHIPTQHACTYESQLSFTGTGTYYASVPMTSLFQYYNIAWNNQLLDQMLVVKDISGVPVDNRYGYDGTWNGSPDFGLYYPMQVRYKAIIISPGGGDPVWD